MPILKASLIFFYFFDSSSLKWRCQNLSSLIVTLQFVECVGVTVILLVLILAIYWLYWGLKKINLIVSKIKKINLIKLKKNFFQWNGGLLLQQQLSTHNLTIETIKIFTEQVLKEATNNYHENRILGHGGQGTVYKGILPDNRIVFFFFFWKGTYIA